MRLDSLCTCTTGSLEFLDIPVHIYLHMVTMHKCKSIMTVFIADIQLMVISM